MKHICDIKITKCHSNAIKKNSLNENKNKNKIEMNQVEIREI